MRPIIRYKIIPILNFKGWNVNPLMKHIWAHAKANIPIRKVFSNTSKASPNIEKTMPKIISNQHRKKWKYFYSFLFKLWHLYVQKNIAILCQLIINMLKNPNIWPNLIFLKFIQNSNLTIFLFYFKFQWGVVINSTTHSWYEHFLFFTCTILN